jgi:putative nucleotidyltransferase with HDIG domain
MSRQKTIPVGDELNWKYSLDDLDLFKDLSHLVHMSVHKVREAMQGCEAFFFVLQSEHRQYCEIVREGNFTIPEDSSFVTYLALMNELIETTDSSIRKFFRDEEILSFLFQQEMKIHFFLPIVYRFRLLGFLALALPARENTELTSEEKQFLGILKDTLRVNLYAALLIDKRLSELLTLNEVTKTIEKYETYDDMLPHIVEIVEQVIGFDRGVYYEYNEFLKRLTPVSMKGIDNPKPLRLGESLSGFVFEKRKPVIIPNLVDHVFFSEINKETFLGASVISIPFLSTQKGFGVLTIARDKRSQEFSVDHLYLMKILASVLVDVLENKMLYNRLEKSYFDTISALCSALEAKDTYTKGHSERVMNYSIGIANELELSPEKVREIKYAAILHDIGKIAISETIIQKPGRLSDEERKQMESHPDIGAAILSPIDFLHKPSEFVKYHHEKADGSGYYHKKAGDYPWEATVINLADSFDALTSNRSYRIASQTTEALDMLKESIGKQFDKKVFDAFLRFLKKNGQIPKEYK